MKKQQKRLKRRLWWALVRDGETMTNHWMPCFCGTKAYAELIAEPDERIVRVRVEEVRPPRRRPA